LSLVQSGNIQSFTMKYSSFNTGVALLLLIFTVNGCKKEKGPGEFTEKQFFRFSDFGCMSVSYEPEYKNNQYLVTSQADLETILTNDCTPQIDFNKYFVLIGHKGFTTGASIDEEKVEENSEEIVYTITFVTNATTAAQDIYYHVVIELPAVQKTIRIVEAVRE
jgi:hypothetical protein